MKEIHKNRFRRLFSLFLCLAILISLGNFSAGAEGGSSLNAAGQGGYRAFTEWYGGTGNPTTAGIERTQIVKVYAKMGERIYFGSSVVNSVVLPSGKATGNATTGKDIVVIDPSGTQTAYDNSSSGARLGYISSPTMERTGPTQLFGANGYNAHLLTATKTGVYEFHFHSTSYNGGNPTAALVDAASPAQGGGTIAFWDITVARQETPASPWTKVPGRTYADYLSLNMGRNNGSGDQSTKVLNSVVYVLTDDGFVYETDFNGIDPWGFVFFANNRGLVSGATNTPLYRSARDPSNDNGLSNLKSSGVEFQKPNNPDTAIDKTHKIFFEQPASDLPSWIMPEKALAPSGVKDVRFEGYKSNEGYVGQGGYFIFEVKNATSATVILDFTDIGGGIVNLSNTVKEGENRFFWDGRDAFGNIVQAGVYGEDNSDIKIQIVPKAGEYHFPMLDVEAAYYGIKIKMTSKVYTLDGKDEIPLEESDRWTIYYDHSNIISTPSDFPNPTQLGGIDSSGGASVYYNGGTASGARGGNAAAVDIWAYFKTKDDIIDQKVENFILVDAPTDRGNIKGFVFFDKDQSRAFHISEGDYPIEGAAVTLKNSLGETVGTTVTDIYGQYAFLGLPFGVYTATVTRPDPIYNVTTTPSGGTEIQTVTLNSTTATEANGRWVNAKDLGYFYEIADKSLEITKEWVVDKSIDLNQPESVSINVIANYVISGTPYTKLARTIELSEGNNWRALINNLPKYHVQGGSNYLITYSVEEYSSPNYVSSVSVEELYQERRFTVTNTAKGLISLTKKDINTDLPLADAVFELYEGILADGTNNDTYIGTYTTNENGLISANVPVTQSYYFKEIKAPDKYKIPANPYTEFIISELTMVKYITITNEKNVCEIKITKVIDAPSEEDQQFVFMINGPSSEALYASVTVKAGTTVNDAHIIYLPPGVYTVSELQVNWRYSLLPDNTSATNGTDTFNYSAGGLTMPVNDPYNTDYTFTFTNRYDNEKWVSGTSSVVNTMEKP